MFTTVRADYDSMFYIFAEDVAHIADKKASGGGDMTNKYYGYIRMNTRI